MYFTSDSDRAFEQPQPRPEQPDEAAPGLENSGVGKSNIG